MYTEHTQSPDHDEKTAIHVPHFTFFLCINRFFLSCVLFCLECFSIKSKMFMSEGIESLPANNMFL